MPHSRAPRVATIMGLVILALVPAMLASIRWQGPEFLLRMLAMIALALATEGVLVAWRGRALAPFLSDLSAPLCAILLALLLPGSLPWWMPGAAVVVAISLGKQAFGGLGDNPFNPAMVAFALLLVLDPDPFRVTAEASPAVMAGLYAAGGLFLAWRRIIPWHMPLAMLGGAALAYVLLSLPVPGSPFLPPRLPSLPLLTMAACFIVTDPVTGCLSNRGRFVFAAGAGALVILLGPGRRVPETLPFAILLMNFAAGWIDRWTRPDRTGAGDA